MAEWEAEDCRSGEGNEAIGREVVGVASDMTARAGRRPCTGRSDEASTAASRGSGVGVSFMAVGSLVLAIHSVEASVTPAERQTAEHRLEMPRPRP